MFWNYLNFFTDKDLFCNSDCFQILADFKIMAITDFWQVESGFMRMISIIHVYKCF